MRTRTLDETPRVYCLRRYELPKTDWGVVGFWALVIVLAGTEFGLAVIGALSVIRRFL